MADKQLSDTPATLPLTLEYEPRHKERVKQHWNVTFARQKKISVVAKRIIARVLDQIRDNDFKLREYYQLTVSDITDCAGINRENAYREVEAALRELSAAAWEFRDVENKKWEVRHLLDTTKDTSVGYANGVITILLNPQLSPYFIEIAHYTTYGLDNYLKLRSWYSMRLYELLSAFRDKGFWEVGLEEYRKLLDCWHKTDPRGRPLKKKDGQPRMKYPSVNDLITNTTTEPLSELAGTDMAFKVTPRYEAERLGRGRRKIVSLRFDLLKTVPKNIPNKWLEDKETGLIIEKLRSWRVSDRNIARYAPVFERAKIGKLIREWELKENSNRHIDNKEKYCNAAFVRSAKAIIDEQQEYALQPKENS